MRPARDDEHPTSGRLVERTRGLPIGGPLVGEYGIPPRDEVEVELTLRS